LYWITALLFTLYVSGAKVSWMKILHVIASVDPRGGGPIAGVLASAEVWARHGHERHIVCLDAPHDPWVLQSSVQTFAMGSSSRWYHALRKVFSWLRYGYTPHLTRWLKEHAKDYDAIVVNGLWNYASYGSWRALHKSNVPYFVFTHGMLDPWFNETYPTKTFFKKIFWRLFEHKVLRDARGVMFTCEEERQLASTSFSPYVAREYVVGYGTRDIEGDPASQRTAFETLLPEIKGCKFILFLSRIHPKKGVDLLIKAFARHAAAFPELDLVIAGPDQTGSKAELQTLAKELGVDNRIYWPGMLSGDAKWGAFRLSEFFVLPSHQENFGIVVAEAMALRKPVLITNKVNIWREIAADNAGKVVNDDLEEIANGLKKMYELTPKQREIVGRNARKCFATRYDLEENAMQLLELFKRLSGDIESPSVVTALPANDWTNGR
jgi:glycosyltransferase involved in cell wall biosynthesis